MHIVLKILILLPIIPIYFLSSGQAQHDYELNNRGAEIFVQAGAEIYVWGDVWNQDSSGNLDNDGLIEVQGDWYTIQGARQSGSSGKVRFSNSGVNTASPQKITGNCSSVFSEGDAGFYDLEIDNDDGNNGLVYLGGGNVAVNHQLIFSQGRIRTGPVAAINGFAYPDTLIMLNPQAGLGSFPGVESGMSSFDERYVEGKLTRKIAPSGGNYGFPVGLKPNPDPAAAEGFQYITFDFVSDAYQLVTVYFDKASSNFISAMPTACLGLLTNCFYGSEHGEWIAGSSLSQPPADPYAVSIYPQNYLSICPPSALYLISKDDSIQGTAGSCGPTPVGLTRGGFEGMGEFGLLGTGVVLDALTGRLTAKDETDFIQLSWQFHMSKPIQISLERSLDGQSFIEIYSDDHVQQSHLLTGNYVDREVFMGQTYYYRLKFSDLDGVIAYSHLAKARLNPNDSFSAQLYPNPNKGLFEVFLSGQKNEVFSIELFNLHGQSILQKNYLHTKAENVIPFDLHYLPAGSYQIAITNEKGRRIMIHMQIRS